MEVRFLKIDVNVHKFRLLYFMFFFYSCLYSIIVYCILGNNPRAPIDSRDALKAP